MARVIIRPNGEPPFETSVDPKELHKATKPAPATHTALPAGTRLNPEAEFNAPVKQPASLPGQGDLLAKAGAIEKPPSAPSMFADEPIEALAGRFDEAFARHAKKRKEEGAGGAPRLFESRSQPTMF